MHVWFPASFSDSVWVQYKSWQMLSIVFLYLISSLMTKCVFFLCIQKPNPHRIACLSGNEKSFLSNQDTLFRN